jgi:hypothetical protein
MPLGTLQKESAMRAIFLALSLTIVSTSALAGNIYKCQEDGRTVYSQIPCGGSSERMHVDTAPAGLRPGEKAMLERAYERDAYSTARRDRAYARDVRKHVSPSERNRIRNLERRKRELQKEARGATLGQGFAIDREIDGINSEIQQIRSGY